MSNENFWSNDTEVSEYELLEEEVQENNEMAEQYSQMQQATPGEIEEIVEESAFELNEDESNIIYNARLRLEMARLYEMLINHDLFEDVDASQQAIQKVQTELKTYIVERLEVLLGIKEEKKKEVIPQSSFSQFNSVEADFLKQLAYKGTFGKSAEIDDDEEEQQSPKGIKPATQKPKLKPLVKKVAPQPKKKQPNQNVTTKPKKETIPQKKRPTVRKNKISSGTIAPRNMTQQEVEALAREDIENLKNKKAFHKMSAKEKAKEIARVNNKYAKPIKPDGAIPYPDFNALQMKYATEQANRAANPNDKQSQFNVLLSKIITEKVNKE